jgi:hypothetical protein
MRDKQTLYRGGHVRQEEGVGQLIQTRFEKSLNETWLTEAAIQEALSKQR